MKIHIFQILSVFILLSCVACEKQLEEEVFSELTPETFLTTEVGMNSVLNSAYSHGQLHFFDAQNAHYFAPGFTSGAFWNKGGGIEVWWASLTNFTWTSNHRYTGGYWLENYAAIRDANLILDHIDNGDFSDEIKNSMVAEATFIRALSYVQLYNFFGPVPLYTSSSTESIFIPRAEESELKSFIEEELITAANSLPRDAAEYGRATKGAALGILCKYYLNTHQWQKSVDITQQIFNLDKYGLENNFADVFALNNEGNSEFLYVIPFVAPTVSQYLNALIFPTDYPRLPTQQVWGARTYLFDDFVNSFEVTDTRKDMIVTEYINTSGDSIVLLGIDQSLSLKYEFDPSASGAGNGNDLPLLRYSDILLSRAEALNELNGPTQEVIDLINEVRGRAGASLLTLSGFSKESLRASIFEEMELEFYFEGKGREDQIRQGVFISNAQARGKNAQPYHVYFAIPQIDIDANPLIEQNEGY